MASLYFATVILAHDTGRIITFSIIVYRNQIQRYYRCVVDEALRSAIKEELRTIFGSARLFEYQLFVLYDSTLGITNIEALDENFANLGYLLCS